MTDPTAPTPQDADTTQAVPTDPTQHVPAQRSGHHGAGHGAGQGAGHSAGHGAGHGPGHQGGHGPAHGTGSAAWTTWVPAAEPHPASRSSTWSPPQGGSTWTPPPMPAQTPAPAAPQTPAPTPKPHVTYLPPPSGPNWGLVLVGVVFGLVGAGVVANQLTGFQVSSLSEMGPSVLVIGGLVCALLGMIGILARRRRG